ncbi:MAG: L,D-transpeptidase family protein [Firmicutes bacterium]|nr:L,D-transpeptidase family protein [Bacillota bacterium]
MRTNFPRQFAAALVPALAVLLAAGFAWGYLDPAAPRRLVPAGVSPAPPAFGLSGKFPDGCVEGRVLRESSPPMRGDDVRELQEYLRKQGLLAGPADGVYGRATADAVRQLQKRLGIPQTGEYDARTWLELEGGTPVGRAKAPPPSGRVEILVDLDACRLTVYSDGAVHKNFTVAIGKPQTPSPVGEFRVVSKGVMEGPAFGSRWLGLNVPWGVYGIHGTNMPWLIGAMVSQGCLRMLNRDVEELYSWIEVGTPVTIVGDLSYIQCREVLRRGYGAQDVVIFQKRLREKGFYDGRADGDFGPATEGAVKAMQAHYGFEQHGVATPDLMRLLELL